MSTDDNQFQRVRWDSDDWQPSDDDENGLPAQPPRGPGLSDADLELLTLAARAIGAVRIEPAEGEQWVHLYFADGSHMYSWNPLLHSDDAFELAVKLGMALNINTYVKDPQTNVNGPTFASEFHECSDALTATRRAVTRAAAEVGKQRA